MALCACILFWRACTLTGHNPDPASPSRWPPPPPPQVLFGLGSILFLVTGVARETRVVGDPAAWPPGLGSLAAGLSAWPDPVACFRHYFPATLIQVCGGHESTSVPGM